MKRHEAEAAGYNMQAFDAMTKARVNLILDQIFFGTLALGMDIIEDKTVDTAWTNGINIGYNPDFINAQTPDQIKGLICHEVLHVANLHHTRRGSREPKRWNKAADYAINPLIPFPLPAGGLDGSRYPNQSTEKIYNQLQDEDKGQGGNGQGPSEPNPAGEVRDFPGTDPNEIKQEETNQKIKQQQAALEAKIKGQLPAHIERMINDNTESRVNWREALQRFVSEAAKNDYSFKRPNYRFLHTGFYLPSLYSEQLPPIVTVIDTSGSINPKMLADYQAELQAIQAQFKPVLHVIYCDAAINKIEIFEADEPLILKPTGGGGTDFRPPFKHVEKEQLQPAALIYLTDLMGSFPIGAAIPDYPVLWITEERTVAPFGETIKY